ncbi:MAG: hypothetical protein IIB61_07110 [Planctomycetes bacterium]|nr:hypothetical protein [Planctomycetota bacterium]
MPNGTTKTTSRRSVTEGIQIPGLRILSSSATEAQRVKFIRSHLVAMAACGRRSLQHAWLVGRELDFVKEKRAVLRGPCWHRFVKSEFRIGERQAYDLLRVYRSFPSLRSLPRDVDSIRGAITYLQIRAQLNEAEKRGRVGRSVSAADDGTPQWECNDGARIANSPRGATTTGIDDPSCTRPASARTRAELRTIQQKLVEIANADNVAFRRVREFVIQQHARVCRSGTTRSETGKRSA